MWEIFILVNNRQIIKVGVRLLNNIKIFYSFVISITWEESKVHDMNYIIMVNMLPFS